MGSEVSKKCLRSFRFVSFGLVWFWFGLVWCDVVCFGVVWFVLVGIDEEERGDVNVALCPVERVGICLWLSRDEGLRGRHPIEASTFRRGEFSLGLLFCLSVCLCCLSVLLRSFRLTLRLKVCFCDLQLRCWKSIMFFLWPNVHSISCAG